MSLIESIRGKWHAVRTLCRMIAWFENWREVWRCYRGRQPLPPIRFREGFVLHHGQWDNPLELIYDVYASGDYSRHQAPSLSGVMVDIGANIGLTTMMFAARNPRLNIHAFEPNPSTNALLKTNIRASGMESRVSVHPEAVGARTGTLKLRTHVTSIFATAFGPATNTTEGVYETVPVIGLDTALARLGSAPVEFLKIDAEGAEAEILENAAAADLARVSRVALEYHDLICPNALARCRKVLEQAGFTTRSYPAIGRPNLGMLYAWREERG